MEVNLHVVGAEITRDTFGNLPRLSSTRGKEYGCFHSNLLKYSSHAVCRAPPCYFTEILVI